MKENMVKNSFLVQFYKETFVCIHHRFLIYCRVTKNKKHVFLHMCLLIYIEVVTNLFENNSLVLSIANIFEIMRYIRKENVL